jgi:hypothetical protein
LRKTGKEGKRRRGKREGGRKEKRRKGGRGRKDATCYLRSILNLMAL